MKTIKEFTEAMKSEEMQEAFDKFINGKECDTAEKAEKLVKEFALENGFELGEGEVSTMAPDDLSDEDLDNVAGGITQDPKKINAIAEIIYDPVNRSDYNGIKILCRNEGLGVMQVIDNRATFDKSDAGPRNDHEQIFW